jgi:multiple sugar transport system permease protein/sn-glycerol 3-phosphate transport system permease protein
MPAVIIVYVWKNVGYVGVVFLAGLQGIPKDLYEAARVDGAGAWQRFVSVTLPGLTPIAFFVL